MAAEVTPPIRCSFCLCCKGQGEPARKIFIEGGPGKVICASCVARAAHLSKKAPPFLKIVRFTAEDEKERA